MALKFYTIVNDMKIDKIEEKIQEDLPPIRVQGLLKKRKEPLEEFLKKFFSKWNHERSTIYVKDKTEQTDPGRRRSIGDIYKICQYYYPKCTLEEVAEILLGQIFNGENHGFRTSYCNVIKKRVFYHEEGSKGGRFNTEQKDEYGRALNTWYKDLSINKTSEDDLDDENESNDDDDYCYEDDNDEYPED